MTNFGIFPRDQRNNEAVSDAADQLKDVEPVVNENEAFESFRAGTPNDQERFGDAVKDETEVSKQNLIQKISEKLKNSANSKKNIARAAIAAVAMAGTVALLANCGRVNDNNNQPGNSVDIEDQNDQIDLDDEFDNNNGGNITVDIDDDGNVTIDHGNTDGGNGETIDDGVDGDIDTDDYNSNTVDPEQYWEGDTFHFDEYAEALGYIYNEDADTFYVNYPDASGKSIGYAGIKVTSNGILIQCHDNASGRTIDLVHSFDGEYAGRGVIEVNGNDACTIDDKNDIAEQLISVDWMISEADSPLAWESSIGTENSVLPGFRIRN